MAQAFDVSSIDDLEELEDKRERTTHANAFTLRNHFNVPALGVSIIALAYLAVAVALGVKCWLLFQPWFN